MRPEIHGALVGGGLGGAVVLVGIVLSEWLTRLRGRRFRLEDVLSELGMLTAHVVAGVSEHRQSTGEPVPAPGWRDKAERCRYLCVEARRLPRWPMRRARQIRREAEDLAARLAAVELNFDLEGRLVRLGEVYELTTLDLAHAAFRSQRTLDDRIAYYRTEGFEARYRGPMTTPLRRLLERRWRALRSGRL